MQLNDYIFDLGMYWKLNQQPLLDKCNHKFTQLKVLMIRNFKFLPSELELVKIVLQRATILERLTLIPPESDGSSKFEGEYAAKYVKLFGSWAASTRVVIKLHEKYVDKSFDNPTHPKRWLHTNAN